MALTLSGFRVRLRGAFSAEDIRKLFIAADSSGQGNVSSQDVAEF